MIERFRSRLDDPTCLAVREEGVHSANPDQQVAKEVEAWL
jgi:hypothetical protein